MSLIAIAKREQLRTLPWGIPSTREKVSERVFWILVWKVLSVRKFWRNTARRWLSKIIPRYCKLSSIL